VTPQNKTVHPVFNPELLDPVDLPAAQRLVRSGQYGAMRKYDGHRIAVSKVAGDVISYNRLGKVIPVPGDVRERLRVLPNTVFLDGEFVAGRYVAFDLLWIDEYDIRELIFEERHSMLLDVLSDTGIAVAPLWVGEDAMMEVIQRERDARGEGIVFKHLRRGYMPGRQGSNLKLKFWVSSTFRIAKKQKTTTHHSFGVEVLKDGYWTYCGSVTCKGPLPEIGTYRECKYLYVGAGGHLYQPEDWGARLDVTDADCTYAQLKIKQDTAQLV
jgi:ATP-dependent DNA ligase